MRSKKGFIMKAREICEQYANNKVIEDLNRELLRHKKAINEIVEQTETIKTTKRFITMYAKEIYEEDEIVGWIVQIDRSVFVIGNVPNDEMLKIFSKNIGDIKGIECKDYDLKNLNTDYC